MIIDAVNRLEYVCTVVPTLLYTVNEIVFAEKSAPHKWSKKEILGHLIDSAANNHQRFVRSQFEHKPVIMYNQDEWNRYNFYQQMDSQQLIQFWLVYNRQLLALFKHLPKESLQRICIVGENELTLQYLITDYVNHMEHHLHQIVSY